MKIQKHIAKRIFSLLMSAMLIFSLAETIYAVDAVPETTENVITEEQEDAVPSDETVLTEKTIPSEETAPSEDAVPSEEAAPSVEAVPSDKAVPAGETESTEAEEPDVPDQPKPKMATAELAYKEYRNNLSWNVALTVTDENGFIIPYCDYTVNAPKITGAGRYKAVIKFKNRRSDYPSITKTFTIRPPVPRLFIASQDKNSVRVMTSGSLNSAMRDRIIYKVYKGDSLVKTVTVKAGDKKYFNNKITGLKKSTKYTIKATYARGKVYSSACRLNVTTVASAPSTKFSSKAVQRLVSGLKGNKTFTFKFAKPVSIDEAYRWERTVMTGLPQYNKYEDDLIYKDHVVTGFKMTYKSKKAAQANKIAPKINSIINGAEKKSGTSAKVRYVNSRLCKTCRYDYDTWRRTKRASYLAYTIYGCLVRHKAVCMGYAMTFDAIMYQLDIPCKLITSSNHMWNKVKIGSKWYHVDVTWNDCTHSSKYLLKTHH